MNRSRDASSQENLKPPKLCSGVSFTFRDRIYSQFSKTLRIRSIQENFSTPLVYIMLSKYMRKIKRRIAVSNGVIISLYTSSVNEGNVSCETRRNRTRHIKFIPGTFRYKLMCCLKSTLHLCRDSLTSTVIYNIIY